MWMNPMKSEERVATNLRTLLILEAVAKADRPLSPTEINREIGLPKQSIHRLCQTLGDYPSVKLEDGIRITHKAFGELLASGQMDKPQ
jgi:DNA-binding IclR family transcriptional regulator